MLCGAVCFVIFKAHDSFWKYKAEVKLSLDLD